MTSKAKSTAKLKSANGKAAPAKKEITPPADAKNYAAKILKEYGPVNAIRATVQKFKSLTRQEMLAIARELKINPATCSTQWQQARNEGITVDLQ